MQEGSRIHSSFQSSQGSDYIAEYPLKKSFVVDDVEITLEGRADGIIKKSTGEFIIDEIKSTVEPLEIFKKDNYEWHLGQAKCYAYMFMMEQGLDFIGIRMTYIRQGKEREKLVDHYTFSIHELQNYVIGLLEDWLVFQNIVFRQNENRNASIRTLKFPFNKYRNGQRELAKYSYAIAKNGGRLFCEAPTGIGKTMSTLFPFIKALELDENSKIFYLTAKTSGKESAYTAVELLKCRGLDIKQVVVTAKDKICFCKGKGCNPDECPYAKGYYNKIQGVLKYALLNYSTFDFETICSLAESNQVCPFELTLDLSLFSDVIICDYNYMFDPISYMKRYFDEDSSHLLALVDEAHNLVDRSRAMYSMSISYDGFQQARKSFRHKKHVKMKREFSKLGKVFEELNDLYSDGDTVIDDFTKEQYKVLNSFVEAGQDVSKNDHELMTKELLDFYLDVNRFLKISEFISDRFVTYVHKEKDNVELHIYCLDASRFISRTLDSIKGSVIFSATLSPIDYYVDNLGGRIDTDPTVIL
ncbi:MAG: ATP-dependent DNA helicase, partial [Bacilli bacterium]|nr:ATP-dependent DNA helicase [Bacilli bacterium]